MVLAVWAWRDSQVGKDLSIEAKVSKLQVTPPQESQTL